MGPMLFSLVSRNVAGQTKKSTTLCNYFIAWSAGNAAAPQVFPAPLPNIPALDSKQLMIPYSSSGVPIIRAPR